MRLPKFINFFSHPKPLIKRFKPFSSRQSNNLHHPASSDLYHWLLVISWSHFLLLISLFYGLINLIFALAYLTTGNGIANAQPGSFKDVFFFSIQTLSTVGYGAMYPQSFYAQILVTLEVLIGLLLLAILTGLMFARFSRPTARVIFSKVAVICSFNGVPTLIFRTANQRENQILEAQVRVSFIRNEITTEGHHLRRFYDLNLLRSQTPMFGLSWSVMHPIDENSPLYGASIDDLEAVDGEIWVTLTGLDETFSQTIHARYTYYWSNIVWNYKFVDIFTRSPNGQVYIDLKNFHNIVPFESNK
ncbi:ion channel [Aphanothece sacrum]|uniref:K+ channel, inward rectifier n=1 Tax=Aphanothece sacrum FPU1 TaxID=1920663 RepID=A0A401IHH7_APHSA|nr:ion channel [Aphanothece sacrum]GBF80742.1 hypothetical protein AsFPU1_2147 [Aphanothece sacrum FPU1]GBF83236.1 hypothetical protein AsFPU3_0276 [Aphanothece sacrum FPU3]